jgi:phosphatidylglycerophosphate synthase
MNIHSSIEQASGRIIVWSYLHAVVIILGTGIALYSQKLWALGTIGALSFFILILLAYKIWTPRHFFGFANLLTLTRLLMVLWIAVCYSRFSNITIIVLSMLILIGDGVDGLIAKRRKEVSSFGEYFDKETDALYLHILIITAIFKDIIPQWLVYVGLFRYLFMLYLLATGKFDRKESRSNAGRYIYVYGCIAFTLPFLNIPGLHLPAVGLAAILLLFSFLRDILWIHSSNSKPG